LNRLIGTATQKKPDTAEFIGTPGDGSGKLGLSLSKFRRIHWTLNEKFIAKNFSLLI